MEDLIYWLRILAVIAIIIAIFTSKYEEKRTSIISDIGADYQQN